MTSSLWCSGQKKPPKVTDPKEKKNAENAVCFFFESIFLSALFGVKKKKKDQSTATTQLCTNGGKTHQLLPSPVLKILLLQTVFQEKKCRNPRTHYSFSCCFDCHLHYPTCPPDCQWQPPALDSRLYRVGFLERGPRSGSRRAARLHRSKQTPRMGRSQRMDVNNCCTAFLQITRYLKQHNGFLSD